MVWWGTEPHLAAHRPPRRTRHRRHSTRPAAVRRTRPDPILVRNLRRYARPRRAQRLPESRGQDHAAALETSWALPEPRGRGHAQRAASGIPACEGPRRAAHGREDPPHGAALLPPGAAARRARPAG